MLEKFHLFIFLHCFSKILKHVFLTIFGDMYNIHYIVRVEISIWLGKIIHLKVTYKNFP